jgi:hypothetical protein
MKRRCLAPAFHPARVMPAFFSVLAGTPTSRHEAYEIALLSE